MLKPRAYVWKDFTGVRFELHLTVNVPMRVSWLQWIVLVLGLLFGCLGVLRRGAAVASIELVVVCRHVAGRRPAV